MAHDRDVENRMQVVPGGAAREAGLALDEELEELEYIARSAPPGLPKFITTGAVLALVAEVRRLRVVEARLREHIAALQSEARAAARHLPE